MCAVKQEHPRNHNTACGAAFACRRSAMALPAPGRWRYGPAGVSYWLWGSRLVVTVGFHSSDVDCDVPTAPGIQKTLASIILPILSIHVSKPLGPERYPTDTCHLLTLATPLYHTFWMYPRTQPLDGRRSVATPRPTRMGHFETLWDTKPDYLSHRRPKLIHRPVLPAYPRPALVRQSRKPVGAATTASATQFGTVPTQAVTPRYPRAPGILESYMDNNLVHPAHRCI